MELRELIEFDFEILEAKKGKEGDTFSILAPFLVGGRKNRNGRLYSIPLLQREVKRVQSAISKGAMIGSADHPAGAFTTLADASHIITKLTVDEKGRGMMEAKILPTTKGKNIMAIVKAGGTLGISARGAGTVSANGTVENDYKLLGVDIVMNPSEPEAVFNADNVFESLDFEDEQKKNKKADLKEAHGGILADSFAQAVNDGCWYGSFEEYKKKYGKPLSEILGLENDEKIILSEEQKNARLFSAFQEAISGGFVGHFNEWKEKNPKVVALATQPKKSPEEEKILSAYREAIEAGFRGSFEKWKTENPKVIEVINKKPLTKQQFASAEARRCNVTVETVLRKWEIDAEIKVKENIRKKAIRIVNRDLIISGASVSKEQRNEMIKAEEKALIIENQKNRR